jgi:hypothetical protein
MADTIKTRSELEADFADGQLRTITAQKIRDFIASLGVGGTMFATEVPFNVTTNWEPVTIFTNSIDTRGINEDLITGELVVGAGADGVFAVDIALGAFLAAGMPGWLEIAVTKRSNDVDPPTLTPYRMKRTLSVNGDGSMSIVASGNLVAGDRIGLAARSDAVVALTTTVQYRALRG